MTQQTSKPERARDAHALPDCIICREFHPDDGEPCPADMTVSVNGGAPFGLCTECAGGEGLNLNAFVGPFATEAEALADAREGRGDA